MTRKVNRYGFVLGLLVGLVIGVFTGSIAIWVAIGVVLGIAITYARFGHKLPRKDDVEILPPTDRHVRTR